MGMYRTANRFHRLFAAICAAAITIMPVAQAKPRRIVSTNVCADQLVLLLAERDRIISISKLASEPEISNFADIAGGFRPNRARAEEIIELGPDLVVGDIQTGRHANSLAKAMGVPVHLIGWPSSITDVANIIRQAGRVLGEDTKAENEIARMQARIRNAQAAVGAPVTALVYEPNGLTTGKGTLTDDILSRSGLTNIAQDLMQASYGSVPLERVIASAPQLLVLDDSYGQSSSRAQSVLRHPAFESLKHRTTVYPIPSRLWLCPGPWVAEAVERLAVQRRLISPSLAPN